MTIWWPSGKCRGLEPSPLNKKQTWLITIVGVVSKIFAHTILYLESPKSYIHHCKAVTGVYDYGTLEGVSVFESGWEGHTPKSVTWYHCRLKTLNFRICGQVADDYHFFAPWCAAVLIALALQEHLLRRLTGWLVTLCPGSSQFFNVAYGKMKESGKVYHVRDVGKKQLHRAAHACKHYY